MNRYLEHSKSFFHDQLDFSLMALGNVLPFFVPLALVYFFPKKWIAVLCALALFLLTARHVHNPAWAAALTLLLLIVEAFLYELRHWGKDMLLIKVSPLCSRFSERNEGFNAETFETHVVNELQDMLLKARNVRESVIRSFEPPLAQEAEHKVSELPLEDHSDYHRLRYALPQLPDLSVKVQDIAVSLDALLQYALRSKVFQDFFRYTCYNAIMDVTLCRPEGVSRRRWKVSIRLESGGTSNVRVLEWEGVKTFKDIAEFILWHVRPTELISYYRGYSERKLAVGSFGDIVGDSRNRPDALIGQGIVYYDLKEIERAMHEWDLALKYPSSAARAHAYLGLAYHNRYDRNRVRLPGAEDKEMTVEEDRGRQQGGVLASLLRRLGVRRGFGEGKQQQELSDVYDDLHASIHHLRVAVRKNPWFVVASAFLGYVYWDLSRREESRKNIELAIKICRRTLNYCDIETRPIDYAVLQRNLGIAYRGLAELQNKRRNLERALEHFQEALRGFAMSKGDGTYDGAEVENNIGLVYFTLSSVENRKENLEKAVDEYRKVIEALDNRMKMQGVKDSEKLQCVYRRADTLVNLGRVHHDFCYVDKRRDNLEAAIGDFWKALDTLESIPPELRDGKHDDRVANVCHHLGFAFRSLGKVEKRRKNARIAACFLDKAFMGRNKDKIDGADTQHYRGMTCKLLAEVENRRANVASALCCYRRAAKVMTQKEHPLDYARLMNNRAAARLVLAEAEDGPIAEKNVGRLVLPELRQALRIKNIEEYPLDHALIMTNKGRALLTLSRAAASRHQKRRYVDGAMECFRKALEVRTKDTTPVRYAETKHWEGCAWLRRTELSGNEKDLDTAQECFKESIEIREKEKLSMDYAKTLCKRAEMNELYCRLMDEREEGGEAAARLAQARSDRELAERIIDDNKTEPFPLVSTVEDGGKTGTPLRRSTAETGRLH